jgi:glycosyltransferase involved in cell wall biosynthesis
LDSLRAQNVEQLEVIAVDGGSTDGSKEQLVESSIVDKVIDQNNGGIYAAINIGIRASSGDVISHISGNDRYTNNTIEKVNKTIASRKNNPVIVHGNRKVVERGCCRVDSDLSASTIPGVHAYQQTCFFTRSFFRDIGLFNTRYPVAADAELQQRASLSSVEWIYLNEVLAICEPGGLSRGTQAVLDKFRILWEYGYYGRILNYATQGVTKFINDD